MDIRAGHYERIDGASRRGKAVDGGGDLWEYDMAGHRMEAEVNIREGDALFADRESIVLEIDGEGVEFKIDGGNAFGEGW